MHGKKLSAQEIGYAQIPPKPHTKLTSYIRQIFAAKFLMR